MKSIGGYFGLEQRRGNHYHSDAIRLNSGRNALEYTIKALGYDKIYVPYFGCDALLHPIQKIGLPVDFYNINDNFDPVFDFGCLLKKDAFLYINYFGIKGETVKRIANFCENLIVDNVQAFFARPIPGVNTFYSPRKFFGVPDGGFLYCTKCLDGKFERDVSYDRVQHLILRVDKSAEDGYDFFCENERRLADSPILKMSYLTEALLSSINYQEVEKKRTENFNYLHDKCKAINLLKFPYEISSAPLAYPLLTNMLDLRQKLIEKKIFVPLYWPNVLHDTPPESLENYYAKNIAYIPIDQRYGSEEMDYIVNTLISFKLL